MKKQNFYKEYCIGCGLCQSEGVCTLQRDKKGFFYPADMDKYGVDKVFFEKVCPASGYMLQSFDKEQIWGRREGVYEAYSTNTEVRKKASSGGVLTAVCTYLLKENKVDDIIHVGEVADSPYETKCYCSETVEDVIRRCGSRYAISAPLIALSELVEADKRYAIIAKPCDIIALRGFMHTEKKYDNIILLLSFFCAGLPSNTANRLLLSELGCEEDKCVRLTYRGDGWPGYATAEDSEGKKHTMSYNDSWGGILGRDVNKYCKFCMDGIGEMADISCGDGWYLNEHMQPDFSEKEGRNIVFTRTEKGEEIFREASEKGYINMSVWANEADIKYIQKYQFTRRSTMKARMLAFRIMNRKVPRYDTAVLNAYAKHATGKEKFKIFAGTVKRILQKKI